MSFKFSVRGYKNAECQLTIIAKLLLVPKASLSDLCFVLEVDKKMRTKKLKWKEHERENDFIFPIIYLTRKMLLHTNNLNKDVFNEQNDDMEISNGFK